MKVVAQKSFANGSVYALQTKDGYLIETTDTFLPFYTKDITNGTNELKSGYLGDRTERWMVGVSVMSGCPVRCKFCATGNMPRYRNLKSSEIVDQLEFVLEQHSDWFVSAKEHKINYTRMGEPFLNIDSVRSAIEIIETRYPNTHHYVSTIGIKDSDFSWVKDNITLQISLHSLDEDRRNELIPYGNKMTIEELGQIRTKSNLKTTLNLTLVDEADFDIDVLKRYFDPEYFFIKLSPINENEYADSNNIKVGVIQESNYL